MQKIINVYCLIFNIFFINLTYSYPITRQPKNSIVLDYSNYNSFQPYGENSYLFGYEIEDPDYHNIQYRDEERHSNGTVTGSYGWVKPDGNIIMVKYVADEQGFRASVEDSAKQINYYGLPTPEKSSIMLNYLNKLNIYKKQTILDRYYRPIDLLFQSKN